MNPVEEARLWAEEAERLLTDGSFDQELKGQIDKLYNYSARRASTNPKGMRAEFSENAEGLFRELRAQGVLRGWDRKVADPHEMAFTYRTMFDDGTQTLRIDGFR